MREIATKKKPVFVQANSNSGQGHVLHYITSFCVVFRLSTLYFWLAGKTETKQVVNRMSKWVEGGGSWKGHESGQAVFIFLAASPLILGRFAREFRGLRRSCARLNKTAMLRRLISFMSSIHLWLFMDSMNCLLSGKSYWETSFIGYKHKLTNSFAGTEWLTEWQNDLFINTFCSLWLNCRYRSVTLTLYY